MCSVSSDAPVRHTYHLKMSVHIVRQFKCRSWILALCNENTWGMTTFGQAFLTVYTDSEYLLLPLGDLRTD